MGDGLIKSYNVYKELGTMCTRFTTWGTVAYLMGSLRAEVMAFVSLHPSSKAGCSARHTGREEGGL